MKKILLMGLGLISLLLGMLGIILPILPTTPFIILAAFLFSKSSPRLYHWILQTKYLGPLVKDWEENGVIRPWAKIMCTILIITSVTLNFLNTELIWWQKGIILICVSTVLIFVLSRPSRAKVL